jgi:hypothetical protein
MPGCRLKKALGDLGLTIKDHHDHQVCFFHCENDTVNADISAHTQLHKEEFGEIVTTVFQNLKNEHLSPTKTRKASTRSKTSDGRGKSSWVSTVMLAPT